MEILQTARLRIREFVSTDDAFILKLLNDPDWITYIGDKGVRSLRDAREYIEKSLRESYGKLGFGMYLVRLKKNDEPIGICGLLKRDALENVDVGYAFLPEFRGHGYATESSKAMIEYGRDTLGHDTIVAIVLEKNKDSIRVLEKLGLKYKNRIRLSADADECCLYVP